MSSDPLGRYEGLLRGWLIESGGRRVDVYYNAIHLTGEIEYWLIDQQGREQSVRPSR